MQIQLAHHPISTSSNHHIIQSSHQPISTSSNQHISKSFFCISFPFNLSPFPLKNQHIIQSAHHPIITSSNHPISFSDNQAYFRKKTVNFLRKKPFI